MGGCPDPRAPSTQSTPLPFYPPLAWTVPRLTVSQRLGIAHVDHHVLLGSARGSRGPGDLAVEGWGSRSTGCLLLFGATTGCGQEESCQQSREARAPTAGGDHHLPLKLDQSEKSEVLRGSGSGLTTSSIWRKEQMSPACPVLSPPTHLAQVGPRGYRLSPEEDPVLPGPS